MKSRFILFLLAAGIAAAGAQTNSPSPAITAPVKILTPSPTKPSIEASPVSASQKTIEHSTSTPPATKKPPVLIPDEADVFRTKSGVEYRGLLARSPRPAGGKFNPLQLINPFAPTSYGISGPSSGSPPRAFRDERTHEPTGFTIISVSR